MKRAMIVGAILLLVGFVMLADMCSWGISDGAYDLVVRVTPTDATPAWVVCFPFNTRPRAEQWLERLELAEKRVVWQAFEEPTYYADPFAGKPFLVYVGFGFHDSSLFGWSWNHSQSYHVVLILAEMPDGRRVGKIVDIPDYRESREVRVTIP
jgi:hypothetical protein